MLLTVAVVDPATVRALRLRNREAEHGIASLRREED
jgi:hypothetical protein